MFSILASFAAAAFLLPNEEKEFLAWMRRTNLIYTGNEYQFRLGIYLVNKRYVQEHNAKKSFKLELNQFAAYTPAEYDSLLGYKMTSQEFTATKSNIVAPESVDWREKGAVTGAKDQGKCGSCWAFSAIAGEEGAWATAGNKLTSFSEQNLVDCVYTCHGCNGGLMTLSFDYVISYQAGKFNLEEDYPYLAVQQGCAYDKTKAAGNVKKYITISAKSEKDLAAKCAEHGPVCVAIDAGSRSFGLYKGGVYIDSTCSSTYLNHGVTCVGYGTEGENNYWIVKNSWGNTWGEEGYIRMLKDHKNQCGISTNAIVPIA